MYASTRPSGNCKCCRESGEKNRKVRQDFSGDCTDECSQIQRALEMHSLQKDQKCSRGFGKRVREYRKIADVVGFVRVMLDGRTEKQGRV